MTPNEQEALSRKYSNDVILVLPLAGGAFAVFNNARELCGIVESISDALVAWQPVAQPTHEKASLEELGLI